MDRIDRIEEKVFKNKRKPTTLSQQILLLHYTGMLDKLYELKITQVKKAELLATILNSDHSNTKKALEAIPKKVSYLKNRFNYEFLQVTFEGLELDRLTEKINVILKELDE